MFVSYRKKIIIGLLLSIATASYAVPPDFQLTRIYGAYTYQCSYQGVDNNGNPYWAFADQGNLYYSLSYGGVWKTQMGNSQYVSVKAYNTITGKITEKGDYLGTYYHCHWQGSPDNYFKVDLDYVTSTSYGPFRSSVVSSTYYVPSYDDAFQWILQGTNIVAVNGSNFISEALYNGSVFIASSEYPPGYWQLADPSSPLRDIVDRDYFELPDPPPVLDAVDAPTPWAPITDPIDPLDLGAVEAYLSDIRQEIRDASILANDTARAIADRQADQSYEYQSDTINNDNSVYGTTIVSDGAQLSMLSQINDSISSLDIGGGGGTSVVDLAILTDDRSISTNVSIVWDAPAPDSQLIPDTQLDAGELDAKTQSVISRFRSLSSLLYFQFPVIGKQSYMAVSIPLSTLNANAVDRDISLDLSQYQDVVDVLRALALFVLSICFIHFARRIIGEAIQ